LKTFKITHPPILHGMENEYILRLVSPMGAVLQPTIGWSWSVLTTRRNKDQNSNSFNESELLTMLTTLSHLYVSFVFTSVVLCWLETVHNKHYARHVTRVKVIQYSNDAPAVTCW